MVKSQWISDGDRISLSVPFFKVDEERRMVSGFATLDNIDKHGDIVDSQASLNAFSRFRGNIREMHQPIAVGKVVSFKQEEFYDKETMKKYSGVFVDVYVSKGAQDTWEKVLDGTLSGFSIGGEINKSDSVVHEDADSMIRVIKDYDLVELSLVDNPANQFANVFSITKLDVGYSITGMATAIKALNVFYCETDTIAFSSDDCEKTCSLCDTTMKNIGWVEESSESQASDVAKVIKQYVAKSTGVIINEGATVGELQAEASDPVEKDINGKGGMNMSEIETPASEDVENTELVEKSSEEVIEEVTETVEKAEEVVAEETSEEVIEKSEEIIEDVATSDAEPDFAKMLDELKAFVVDNISKSDGSEVPSVDEIISQMKGSISKSMEEISARHEEVSKAVSEVQNDMKDIKNRMDSYESATATKKSFDLDEESKEIVTKSTQSIWKGHFLGVRDL